MSAVISNWPTRVPGRPYLWVLDLESERPAPRCVAHNFRTNGLGVCDPCVAAWRVSLGASADTWRECRVCGFPLHPSVESAGFDTCPSCTARAVSA